MNPKTKSLIRTAVIAALYAGITVASFPLSFGGVQFRLSEALLILAAYSGSAVPGLTLGCLLANIVSPLGPLDMAVGAGATLLTALTVHFFSYRVSSLALRSAFAAFAAALINGVAVGGEIACLTLPAGTSAFWLSFLWVAVGELAVCGILCYPLMKLIKKNAILFSFFKSDKECV